MRALVSAVLSATCGIDAARSELSRAAAIETDIEALGTLAEWSEGLAQMLAGFVREEFMRGPLSRLQAFAALPVLNRFKRRVDYRRHNGASLLGLRGLVLKSHGSADVLAFECALNRGFEEARHPVLERTVAAMQPFVEQLEQLHRGQSAAAGA